MYLSWSTWSGVLTYSYMKWGQKRLPWDQITYNRQQHNAKEMSMTLQLLICKELDLDKVTHTNNQTQIEDDKEMKETEIPF